MNIMLIVILVYTIPMFIVGVIAVLGTDMPIEGIVAASVFWPFVVLVYLLLGLSVVVITLMDTLDSGAR